MSARLRPLVLILCTLALAALAAAEPRLILSKKFPRSTPEYVELRITPDGKVEYREKPGEDPLLIRLAPAELQAVFDAAKRCGNFSRPLESGLKVAFMGDKLFHWEDGAESHEVHFNFTQDPDGQAMLDWYERIVESIELRIDLERTARYDPLGVNQALLALEAAHDSKRLVAVDQYLPMLDRVSKNEKYMRMARERAARIADIFRGVDPAKAGQ